LVPGTSTEMAQSYGSLPGSERIRAIKDEDGMFTAFDAYPWTKDRMFMVSAMARYPRTLPFMPPCSLLSTKEVLVFRIY
jgi:hypothetical protein